MPGNLLVCALYQLWFQWSIMSPAPSDPVSAFKYNPFIWWQTLELVAYSLVSPESFLLSCGVCVPFSAITSSTIKKLNAISHSQADRVKLQFTDLCQSVLSCFQMTASLFPMIHWNAQPCISAPARSNSVEQSDAFP